MSASVVVTALGWATGEASTDPTIVANQLKMIAETYDEIVTHSRNQRSDDTEHEGGSASAGAGAGSGLGAGGGAETGSGGGGGGGSGTVVDEKERGRFGDDELGDLQQRMASVVPQLYQTLDRVCGAVQANQGRLLDRDVVQRLQDVLSGQVKGRWGAGVGRCAGG